MTAVIDEYIDMMFCRDSVNWDGKKSGKNPEKQARAEGQKVGERERDKGRYGSALPWLGACGVVQGGVSRVR